MFFGSLAISLMAPAVCLGMPTDNTVVKLAATVKHKPAPCKSASSFNLLTYNVAGLPEIINRNAIFNKQDNAALIGKNLREQQYDIIHLQKDFHLHEIIFINDNHTYHTLSSGNVMYGDGLNTLSNYNGFDFSRYTWKECAIDGVDCLTPKGFTYMTSHIDGLDVDMYNLHSDAGNQWLDRKARSMGLDQLLRHIKKHSKGRPVILAGDFNDLWTCSKRGIIKLTEAGFTDAWVKLHHNGTIPEPNGKANECAHPPQDNSCEGVDKVFYRSGKSVNLDAVKFDYESKIFVSDNEQPLSDHYPVRVDFTWSRKESKGSKEVKEPKTPKDLKKPDETEDIKVPEEHEEAEGTKEAKEHKEHKSHKAHKAHKEVKKPQETEEGEEGEGED